MCTGTQVHWYTTSKQCGTHHVVVPKRGTDVLGPVLHAAVVHVLRERLQRVVVLPRSAGPGE